MKYIDTHCHVQFNAYKDDSEAVIRRALDAGVGMIVAGTQKDTGRRAVDWAEKNDSGVWAAVGLHPTHLFDDNVDGEIDGDVISYKTREEKFDREFYKSLCASDKVVAIGEVGIDYYHKPENVGDKDFKTRQIEVMEEQALLAKDLNLPLILHSRSSEKDIGGAYADLYQILRRADCRGVLHCYVGDWETAKKFLDLGYYLGVTGIITFSPAKVAQVIDTVKNAPADRLLSETDAPYLSPAPHRGKRNEPAYVKYVVQKIAELRGVDEEVIAEIILKNAQNLFTKMT